MTINIDNNAATEPPKASGRGGLRTAIFVAIFLHVIAAIVAIVYVPDWSGKASSPRESDQASANTNTAKTPTNTPTEETAEPVAPKPKDDGWNQRVEDKFEKLLDAAGERDDDENRTELEKKADELNRVSSPEAIEKMAPVLTNVLSLKPRATAPAETKPKGVFDAATAQFHTVRREENESGEPRYVSIMLDAEGRTLEVELEAADGESIYETMQLIEKNPLLEKVYRKLVIPVIDRATAAANATGKKPSAEESDPNENAPAKEPSLERLRDELP